MTFRLLVRLTVLAVSMCGAVFAASDLELEKLTGKTILLFTPHPDDDTFCCSGTLALLAKNGNNVRIVIYTNDDKGLLDLEITSERLAGIRMREEEAACHVIGIPVTIFNGWNTTMGCSSTPTRAIWWKK